MRRNGEKRRYWLDDPKHVTLLYRVLIGICLGLMGIDLFLAKVVHFPWDRWIGFYAIYGFVSYVTVVFVGTLVRRALGRREDYYDR